MDVLNFCSGLLLLVDRRVVIQMSFNKYSIILFPRCQVQNEIVSSLEAMIENVLGLKLGRILHV